MNRTAARSFAYTLLGMLWLTSSCYAKQVTPVDAPLQASEEALPLVSGPFFVLYGDSYLPCDYRAVQAAFAASGQPALMTVYRNAGQWDKSNVEFAAGRIRVYDKTRTTPQMDCIDYGLGVFAPRVFAALPAGEPADLAAVYQQLLARGELAGYRVTERFYHIGSFAALEETRQFLQTANTSS